MLRLSAALALVLFFCPGVWAATPTEALRQVFGQADTILTDPDTEDRPLERLLALRKLVNEAFDFRSAAELASGAHWQDRTPTEQEEFTRLFADLFERSFVARMASKASLAGGTRIRYLAESIDGGSALVLTAVDRRDGGEMRLDYQMIEHDGGWKVRDIAIDGISVVANYRAQLDRVLASLSFPELLSQMKAKATTVAASASVVDAPPPARTSFAVAASVQEEVPDIPRPDLPPVVVGLDAPIPQRAEDTARHVESVKAPPIMHAATNGTTSTVSSPPARTTRAYWLRIGTFEDVDEAGRLAARLHESNLVVAFERARAAGTAPLLGVRMGPFPDVAEAVSKLLELQAKGHDPFLFAERD